jgi:hypothetical protein
MSMALNLPALPLETYREIFSHLGLQELGRCSQVCSDWRRLIGDDSVKVARQAFPILEGDVTSTPNLKLLLQEFASRLHSNDEIALGVQAFVKQISFGQNGRFRCLVRPGSPYKAICLEFKGSTGTIPQYRSSLQETALDFHFKQDCIAINGMGEGTLVTHQPRYNTKSPSSKRYGYQSNKWFGGNPTEIIATYTVKPFQAVLRFPLTCRAEEWIDLQPELAQRIEDIVKKKLDELEDQLNRRHSAMVYASAASTALLTVAFFNFWPR